MGNFDLKKKLRPIFQCLNFHDREAVTLSGPLCLGKRRSPFFVIKFKDNKTTQIYINGKSLLHCQV